VDPRGNVFAFAGRSNGQECFIIKFNENLEYIKHFGRNGKGPGEFSTSDSGISYRISIAPNGDVYVFDESPQRLVVFDNDGNYKEDIQLTRDYWKSIGLLNTIRSVGNGKFIAFQNSNKTTPYGILFTLNPPLIKLRYSITGKEFILHHNFTFSETYYGSHCIVDNDFRHFVFGDSQRFNFYVYDLDGNVKVKKEDDTRGMGNFTSKEYEYIIDQSFTPKSNYSAYWNNQLKRWKGDPEFKTFLKEIKKSKNVIAYIRLDGEKIYVFTVPDDITIKNKWPVEIYNLEGRLLRKGFFKKIPAKIWKDFAFFYDRDEERDDPLIVKHKILDK
jgi:hypothetical protein